MLTQHLFATKKTEPKPKPKTWALNLMGFNVLNSWMAMYSRRGRSIDVLHDFLCILFEWKEKTIISVEMCMLSMTRMAASPLNGGEMHRTTSKFYISIKKRSYLATESLRRFTDSSCLPRTDAHHMRVNGTWNAVLHLGVQLWEDVSCKEVDNWIIKLRQHTASHSTQK